MAPVSLPRAPPRTLLGGLSSWVCPHNTGWVSRAQDVTHTPSLGAHEGMRSPSQWKRQRVQTDTGLHSKTVATRVSNLSVYALSCFSHDGLCENQRILELEGPF